MIFLNIIQENMEIYRVLYFSSGYSSIHKQIIDSIRIKGNDVVPCLYTLHYSKEMFEYPSDAIIYNHKSKMRGMVSWKKRLDVIVDYYEKAIDWNNVKILHAHLLYTDGYICRKLSARHNIPFLVTVRNTDINTKYYRLPIIKKQMLKTIKEASKIIYLGEAYKKELLKRLDYNLSKCIKDKMIHIPNGVDNFWHDNLNKESKHIQNNSINLLTVGRIESNKNQILVCNAVHNLLKKGYKIKYYLVGDCKNNTLKKIISSYKWTTIIPFQEKHDLIDYYRKCDIYIMPSKTETFGLVYVEALTQGLPVIYSKGQGFDCQFEEGVVGYHVDCNNVNEIEDAIIKICNHYDEISSRCVRMASFFTWDHIGQLFIRAYQESINEYSNFI